MNKRVLLCFHNNFLNNELGCNSYIFEMARYLKDAGCSLDLFSLTNVWNNFDNFYELNNKRKLIDNLYLYSPDPCNQEKENQSNYIRETYSKSVFYLMGLPLFTRHSIDRRLQNRSLDFGWIKPSTVDYFQKLIDENQYDSINVHYLQMAELVRHIKKPDKTRLIYSAQDAFYMMGGFFPQGLEGMLHILPREIAIMNLFHEVLFISNDEKIFFERFLPGVTTRHFPHALSRKVLRSRDKDIDILFIGHMNPHNLKGLMWFIDEVSPHMNAEIRITVCGRVWWSFMNDAPKYLDKAERLGIIRIDFAKDLDDLYARTRLSICPLLSGTGMKIKTIDSLARGIPVVSTTWGVDGFADKHNNGCLVSNDPKEFARLINVLISDQQRYDELVEEGKRYFDQYLSLEANARVLDIAFELDQLGPDGKTECALNRK